MPIDFLFCTVELTFECKKFGVCSRFVAVNEDVKGYKGDRKRFILAYGKLCSKHKSSRDRKKSNDLGFRIKLKTISYFFIESNSPHAKNRKLLRERN